MKNAFVIYHDLIEGIVAAMDARDPYTARHTERVSDIAQLICRNMGFSEEETEMIHIAAHVHDIGKIGVPDSVLLKASVLTDEEWILMKNHSETGFQILKKVSGFGEVAFIVRHHHERWDGKGYPSGLAAGNIPLGSRIIAVADSIDAMLSDRNYRKAMTAAQCRVEIERNSGIMYDPAVTAVVLENWPVFEAFYEPQAAGVEAGIAEKGA
jgi:HD-GYP domain-containing protein (c-di-GMP phosphodiesterase class II)